MLFPNCSEVVLRVGNTIMCSVSDTDNSEFSDLFATLDKLLEIGIEENRINIGLSDGGSMQDFKEWLKEPDSKIPGYREYKKEKKEYMKFIK